MRAHIRFIVSAPSPHDHLLRVTLEVDAIKESPTVELSMPVWSPGSYLVREYARHVQNLRAFDDTGAPRAVRKLDKATWQVDTAHCKGLRVEYEVFSHDLNVRGNHVDDTHAFFTGVATYLYPHGRTGELVELQVVVPDGYRWQVFTGLEALDASAHLFVAPDFDVLFDSPVEMGPHEPLEFEVDGVAHRMVLCGPTNADRAALARDLPAVVEANRRVFGELPYRDYVFITLVGDARGGGLEHLNSTALLFARDGFRRGKEPGGLEDGHLNFLRLCCHEHFHAWNVKRIRPERLGPFDYQQENYTRDLWTVEGVTSYYDTLGLVRAGLIDANGYLLRILELIHQYERIPGRKLQSLEDASFDAWIKLYRPDEHTRNSTVSYYLKGELVCMLLDITLRAATAGEKSLDTVLRHLWEQYFKVDGSGYPEGGYEKIIADACGVDVRAFFDAYIRGTEDFAWQELLEPVGLELERTSRTPAMAWLGANTQVREGRLTVASVPTGSPAERGGLYAGDEILALDGWKVTGENLSELLLDKSPGARARVHVFRRGVLRECVVELGQAPADVYRFRTRADASEAARALLRGWLGSDEVQAEYTK